MAEDRQPTGSGSPGRVIEAHVDDWEELAIDYLDGTLDSDSRAAVDAHLENCAACAARLGVQMSVCKLVQQVTLEDSPSGLEDEVIGEILFPPAPPRTIVPARQPSFWSRRRSKFKPWIPVTVAVVAFFAVMISVGVLRSGGAMETADVTTTAGAATTAVARAESTFAANATTAAPQATEVASDGAVMGAATPSQDTSTGVGGAGATTTTVVAPTMTTGPGATYAPLQDKKTMVAELQAAGAPVYFVFQTMNAASGMSADETGAALAEQITMLTGLQPVPGDLALGRTTFAAYVPKKDATALVELLQSIGSSLQLTLSLVTEPIAVSGAAKAADYGTALRDNQASLPELSATKTPQPAVTKYSFTTSTVVADSAELPPDWTGPDEAGTHVLVVIYLGE
jgi:anti-sigma factor RsiW